jgi:hypothetical protein
LLKSLDSPSEAGVLHLKVAWDLTRWRVELSSAGQLSILSIIYQWQIGIVDSLFGLNSRFWSEIVDCMG